MSAATKNGGDEHNSDAGVSITPVMLFLVAGLIVRSLIDVELRDAGASPAVAKLLSALGGFGFLLILMCPILIRNRTFLRSQLQRPFSWPNLLVASIALGLVLWLTEMLVLAAIAPLDWPYAFTSRLAMSPGYSFSCDHSVAFWLAFPVLVIVTPIVEEIIYRGIILRALLRTGTTTAILASAALFAVLHNPATMPFAFIVGIFLALQTIHSETLWAAIVTHGITNLMVLFSAHCLAGQWRPAASSWPLLLTETLMVFSLLACLVAAWALATRNRIGTEPVRPAPT